WNDLTDREAQIVDLLAHGRSMSHAAQELGLATNTVRNYVQRIYEKLDVHSKQELIELLDATRQQGGSRDQPPLG
ncbi:MAG: helix-turn-helix transcriptional regulator, partial [Coriobacteriia bacterium]|nr:helix-turn-helix transcriptional regulator [Coriobacteriia bacterium]